MTDQIIQIIVQLCGICAMIFCIGAFLTKSRKTILIMQIIGMGMWTIHFLLLGEYAGAAMNGLAVARALVYVRRGKQKWADSKLVPAIFVAVFLAAGLFTWYLGDDLWFLPAFAMTVTSIGLFFKNEQTMRIINLFSSPPWIVYNVFAHSLAAIITESLTMVSVIAALIIYERKKKTPVDEATQPSKPAEASVKSESNNKTVE